MDVQIKQEVDFKIKTGSGLVQEGLQSKPPSSLVEGMLKLRVLHVTRFLFLLTPCDFQCFEIYICKWNISRRF